MKVPFITIRYSDIRKTSPERISVQPANLRSVWVQRTDLQVTHILKIKSIWWNEMKGKMNSPYTWRHQTNRLSSPTSLALILNCKLQFYRGQIPKAAKTKWISSWKQRELATGLPKKLSQTRLGGEYSACDIIVHRAYLATESSLNGNVWSCQKVSFVALNSMNINFKKIGRTLWVQCEFNFCTKHRLLLLVTIKGAPAITALELYWPCTN